MMHAVYRTSDGSLVSTGTVVADPLPSGLASRLLSAQEQEWLATGGLWDQATRVVLQPVPVVPQTVTAWQIRRYLLSQGITLAAVSQVIDSIPDATLREQVRIDWEYGPYVERSHPMLPALATAVGILDLDAAFVEAAKLG